MKMPEYFRDQLFKALLGPIDVFPIGDIARSMLENIARRDLENITPIIEGLMDLAKGPVPTTFPDGAYTVHAISIQNANVAEGTEVHVCIRGREGHKLFDMYVPPPVGIAVTHKAREYY